MDDKKGAGAEEGGEEERGCDAIVVEHAVGASDFFPGGEARFAGTAIGWNGEG